MVVEIVRVMLPEENMMKAPEKRVETGWQTRKERVLNLLVDRLLDSDGLQSCRSRTRHVSKMCEYKKHVSATDLGQVPGEVDVDSVHDGQVVRQQLQGQHVDQTLQAVDGERNSDGPVLVADGGVIVVANDDCNEARSVVSN